MSQHHLLKYFPLLIELLYSTGHSEFFLRLKVSNLIHATFTWWWNAVKGTQIYDLMGRTTHFMRAAAAIWQLIDTLSSIQSLLLKLESQRVIAPKSYISLRFFTRGLQNIHKNVPIFHRYFKYQSDLLGHTGSRIFLYDISRKFWHFNFS